jgi:hypothetical protein
MATQNSIKGLSFKEQGDDIPLVCPICRHEVMPANVSEAEDAEISVCKHVILQHLWGGDPDISIPEITAWWKSLEAKRVELEEADVRPETLYRECPHIDYLVEHATWSPGRDFTASFGFKNREP